MHAVKKEIKTKKKIDWFNSFFMGFFTLASIFGTYYAIKIEGFNWAIALPFIVLYYATGISITAGYHRLFSHRAYKAGLIPKIIFLFFGAAAFQNSCLKWSMDHRRHHQHCDEDTDPYNINEGFWHAHIGWILTKDLNPGFSDKFAKDLAKDPLILFQNKYYFPIAIFASFVIPTLWGWSLGIPLSGLFIAGFLRMTFVHHMTFFINSLCHIVGTQPFTNTNTAKDSPIMALFSFGEGYHNFHHYFQTDYRNGIRWFDYDPGKWTINILKVLGQAHSIKRTPEEDILKARLTMEAIRFEKKAGEAISHDTKLELLKKNIEEKLQKGKKLRKEYLEWKRDVSTQGHNKLIELKKRMKENQEEVTMTIQQWRSLQRTLLLSA